MPTEYYIDSIIGDIEGARENIVNNPIYNILNLCRVLYYLQEGHVSSKKEGGQWALSNIEKSYIDIIKLAIELYENPDKDINFNSKELVVFAEFMLNKIESMI